MALPVRASLILIATCLGLGGAAAAPVVKATPKAKPGVAAHATPAAPVVTSATGFFVIRRTEDAWTVMDPSGIERVDGGPVRRTYRVTVRRNLCW